MWFSTSRISVLRRLSCLESLWQGFVSGVGSACFFFFLGGGGEGGEVLGFSSPSRGV